MEKTRILVVDDEKHIAELISLYLMKEGYEKGRYMTAERLWMNFIHLSRSL